MSSLLESDKATKKLSSSSSFKANKYVKIFDTIVKKAKQPIKRSAILKPPKIKRVGKVIPFKPFLGEVIESSKYATINVSRDLYTVMQPAAHSDLRKSKMVKPLVGLFRTGQPMMIVKRDKILDKNLEIQNRTAIVKNMKYEEDSTLRFKRMVHGRLNNNVVEIIENNTPLESTRFTNNDSYGRLSSMLFNPNNGHEKSADKNTSSFTTFRNQSIHSETSTLNLSESSFSNIKHDPSLSDKSSTIIRFTPKDMSTPSRDNMSTEATHIRQMLREKLESTAKEIVSSLYTRSSTIFQDIKQDLLQVKQCLTKSESVLTNQSKDSLNDSFKGYDFIDSPFILSDNEDLSKKSQTPSIPNSSLVDFLKDSSFSPNTSFEGNLTLDFESPSKLSADNDQCAYNLSQSLSVISLSSCSPSANSRNQSFCNVESKSFFNCSDVTKLASTKRPRFLGCGASTLSQSSEELVQSKRKRANEHEFAASENSSNFSFGSNVNVSLMSDREPIF